ncbi:MAG TPA: VOC family protein [Candidatus Acidoferrum sp.]
MLGDNVAVATIAVKDLSAAKKFYEQMLGLKLSGPAESAEVATYQAGNTKLLVYRSQYAGTNKGTSVTWIAGEEIADLVNSLKTKGIKFEHYDFPGAKHEEDVHIIGPIKAAWFKDPDGNIHCITNN